MVTHIHILFVASYNRTSVQSFNSSCPRTLTTSDDVRGQAEDSRKTRFNHDEFNEELSEQEGRLPL
jgi:hypothetical protein